MGFAYALTGIIPAVFFMWYVDRVDRKRPEPRKILRLVALFGGLSTIPCIIVQLVLDKGLSINEHTPAGALFTSYISAALTEESAKAVVLFLVVWRHPAFDERMDGIVYATRAGLGFALVENVGYLFGAHTDGGFAFTFVVRALLAVPGHAIWAGFMGYFAARKRFDGKGPGLLGGLALAIFMHGTYDAALFMMGALPKGAQALVLLLIPIPLVVIVGGYLWLRSLSKQAIALDDAAAPHVDDQLPRLPLGMGFVLR